MIIPNFISVDSTLNSLIITSNFGIRKKIQIKKYLKSDNFSKDFNQIIRKNFVDFSKVKLLIVNLGPGSYAGIRNILTCLKIISLIKKIKIVGISNYDLWRIVGKKTSKNTKIVMQIGNFFLDVSGKHKKLEIEQINKLLTVKKILSNYEYSGIFRNNLIPFSYNYKDIELLIKKKLIVDKNIIPKY